MPTVPVADALAGVAERVWITVPAIVTAPAKVAAPVVDNVPVTDTPALAAVKIDTPAACKIVEVVPVIYVEAPPPAYIPCMVRELKSGGVNEIAP